MDPNGNDSNSGTSPSAPWKTIARVNSADLQAGDVVYFKAGGLWREELKPPTGGNAQYPITFTRYGTGAAPIFSGSDLVTGWQLSDGAVYSAALGPSPNNVFVDGDPGWGVTHACCLASQTCSPSGSCAIGPMTAGSWYYDSTSSQLYLWPSDSSDPANHSVEAATRIAGTYLVADGGEKSNLVFDGLAMERTGGYGFFSYSSDQNGAGLTGIVVRNCTITQTGTGPVDSGGYYNGIHYSQATEMPTAPVFEGNTISYTGNHGNGINCQAADGARILNNDVSHFNHHGLDMKYSNNVLVQGNVVHDSRGNGIYQEYSANGLIEQNRVFNLTGTVAGTASGVQIDVGSSTPFIYNNSIYNVISGIYLKVAGTAENNAVTNASSASLEAIAGGTFDYNDWGSNPVISWFGNSDTYAQWLALGGHNNDLAADPLWTNPGAGDFTLELGSPCIDAGTDVGLPYNGTAPDIGAVESNY